MNDYNNGALPDPCLRLDYGFGEQWASVELGDGTGYVRLADYEKVAGENAELRELVRMERECALHTDCVESCPYHYESGGWWECKRDDMRASLGLADDE